MKIAVNTRLLLPGKLEGIGWFACETLRRITQQHPEHEFVFIFDRPYSEEFLFSSNITPVVTYPQARHPVLWYLFFDWGVPPVLRKHKPDLFFSPDGWLSLRTRVPSMPVIHDLNFFHNPQWVSRGPRQYYNYFFPRFIRQAKRIATVSEFSKQDISNRFLVGPERIDVVYNGANNTYKPLSGEEVQVTRDTYTRGKPYFLFLSLVHPRKNLTRIIAAYNQFREKTSAGVLLLVVGSTKYWTDDTREAWEQSPYSDDIIFTGRLNGEALNHVMASCLALVYASLFEGFGIPILEALYCKVPVIASNTSSMPEVGGDAVHYVDPYSVSSITDGLVKIYSDPAYSEALTQKGVAQASKFTWDRTADLLWAGMEKALAK